MQRASEPLLKAPQMILMCSWEEDFLLSKLGHVALGTPSQDCQACLPWEMETVSPTAGNGPLGEEPLPPDWRVPGWEPVPLGSSQGSSVPRCKVWVLWKVP